MTSLIPPPIAEQRPHEVVFGAVEGQNRGLNPFKQQRKYPDPWFWLRDDDRKNEAVLAHLRLENDYAQQQTAHLKGLEEKLYNEHVGHLNETDEKPPYLHGNFFYYTRTVKGLSYKIHCRKPKSEGWLPDPAAVEQVLLDENKVAEGHPQCVIGSVTPSTDHSLLAFCVDYSGDEVYDVVFRDLSTGEDLPDTVKGVAAGLAWGPDNKTLYYCTQDATKRPYKLWRHVLGTDCATDVCLFTENDEQFWFGFGKSKSGRFLFAESGSSETSEIWFLDLHAPDAELKLIQGRQFGLRYSIEHHGDGFLIWTNKDGAINNRLMTAPVATPSQEHWVEAIPYDATRKIDDVEVFSDFVVLEGRQGGLSRVWLLDAPGGTRIDAGSLRQLQFHEELYTVSLSVNKVMDAPFVRILYSSLTTPNTWYNYEMKRDAASPLTVVKQETILNFDSNKYTCFRAFAKAPDGAMIPMSVVRAKSLYDADGGVKEDGKPPAAKPMMLYGYGSYGMSMDPHFDARILPYLDRGVIYTVAHVRGGGEMGRYWYEEQGKYLNKRNTFSDFIACAEHMIDNGFTTPDLLACEGRSAGGLLVGATINMRPDLFKVAVCGVPFVDLMNTMCDPTIPLTTGEWEEWGNPNEDKYFSYMLSYSPYDNVRAQPYPNIVITAGLHDPRVAYWEPAKWASKLRSLKIDNNDIILKTDLESGHFSASDRYKYLRQKSFEQAAVLDKLGLAAAEVKALSS